MADLFLNFKDFQHEKTDDKSTTLKHKKLGHKITLAHNVLSPKNKQALMDMAKSAKKSQTPDQANEAESQDSGYGKVIRMAKGGGIPLKKTQPYVIPAEQRDSSPTPPPRDQTQKEMLHDVGTGANGGANKPSWNPKSWLAEGGQARQMMAEDGYVQPQPTEDDSFLHKVGEGIGNYVVRPAVDFAKGVYNEGASALHGAEEGAKQFVSGAKDVAGGVMKGADIQMPAAAPEPPPLDPNSIKQPMPQPQAMPDQGLAAPQSEPPQEDPSKGYLGTMEDALKKRMQATRATATAEGNLGKANIQERNETWGEQQLAQSAYDDSVKEIDGHVRDLEQDVKNGYINPDRYWTGSKNPQTGQMEGGHSRIATGIGMILAGFNPTNSPNAAVNFLKFQMEQNLQGQKENLNAKGNLLSTMMHQYGNARDGLTASRLVLADDLANRLGVAADTAKLPQAKAAALDARGKLLMEYAPMRRQLEMSQALMKAANSGHAQSSGAIERLLNQEAQINPEGFKIHSAAYVPGVGMSTSLHPISEGVRSQIVAAHNENDLYNIALHMAHTPIPNPITHPVEYAKFSRVAASLQQNLIAKVKQAQQDGVYKPSEAKFLESQLGGSPADIFRSITTIPQLQQMQQNSQKEYKNLLDSVGIKGAPLPSFAPAQQPQSNAQDIPIGTPASNKQGQRVFYKGNNQWDPK